MSSKNTGIVRWFDTKKGYGFIDGANGEEAFVHYRSILAEGFKNLREGDQVKYLQTRSEKGWQAAEVEPASGNT